MYGSDMIPKHSESSRFLRVLMGVAEQCTFIYTVVLPYACSSRPVALTRL